MDIVTDEVPSSPDSHRMSFHSSNDCHIKSSYSNKRSTISSSAHTTMHLLPLSLHGKHLEDSMYCTTPPSLYFTNSILEEATESLKKHFPQAETIKKVSECKLIENKLVHIKIRGKLILTLNSLYFISKVKKLEWQLGDILDIEKEDTEKNSSWLYSIRIIDFHNNHVGKIHSISYPSQDSRDQMWKSLYRIFFDRSVELNTALHVAVLKNDRSRVLALINQDPLKLQVFNWANQTPLVVASIENRMEMVKILLECYSQNDNIDINITDERGNNLLHVVCQERKIQDDILLLLFQFKQLDVNHKNINKTTPLHYFCKHTESVHCDLLLEEMIKAGANLNATTEDGETPLHRAMQNQNGMSAMLVAELLKNGANPNTKTQNSQDIPLHYAIRLGRKDLLSLLLNAGSDIFAKNADGYDALNLAIHEQEQAEKLGSNFSANMKPLIKTLRNVIQLFEILDDCGLSDCKEKFIEEEIHLDLERLIYLDDQILKKKFKIGIGNLLKLKRYFPLLKEEIMQEKERNREQKEILDVLEKSTVMAQNVERIRNILSLNEWEIYNPQIEYFKRLGRGSSGDVYLATCGGKEVAVKILHATESQAELDEFMFEVHMLIRLDSPYVCHFYGATVIPYLSMVMEYCGNGSLFLYLQKNKKLPWKLLLSFAHDLSSGLKYLHTHNPPIIHRDFKSLNLLVSSSLQVKLCDFGLSRMYDTHKSTFQKLRGTQVYIAPEILQNVKVSVKSDVYSMGIVYWEIIYAGVMGEYAIPYSEYGRQTSTAVLLQALEGRRPSLPHHCPELFGALYLRCVDPLPTLRPTSEEAASIIETIQAHYNQSPSLWESTYKQSPSEDTLTKIVTGSTPDLDEDPHTESEKNENSNNSDDDKIPDETGKNKIPY